MSDNHARLFASTVPRNGSSNTIGENVSDPGETNTTGENEFVGWYTPKLCDAWQQCTSTLRPNDNPEDEEPNQDSGERLSPNKPDAESQFGIEMDDIVESFRHDEISVWKSGPVRSFGAQCLRL